MGLGVQTNSNKTRPGTLPKARERNLAGSAHGMAAMVGAQGFTLYCGAALLPCLSWQSTALYFLGLAGGGQAMGLSWGTAPGEF